MALLVTKPNGLYKNVRNRQCQTSEEADLLYELTCFWMSLMATQPLVQGVKSSVQPQQISAQSARRDIESSYLPSTGPERYQADTPARSQRTSPGKQLIFHLRTSGNYRSTFTLVKKLCISLQPILYSLSF